jgi:hypothetical protein
MFLKILLSLRINMTAQFDYGTPDPHCLMNQQMERGRRGSLK